MDFPNLRISQVVYVTSHKITTTTSHALHSLFKKTIEPLIGYFLKICIFREAALQGRLSRWVILPITTKIGNLWLHCRGFPSQFTTFQQERLARSRDFLAEFGTTEQILTKDGVSLRFTYYSAQQFNSWIENQGGIREPDFIRVKDEASRKNLEKLEMFKFKKTQDGFQIPKISAGSNKICILRCNGFGLPIETDKKLIGLHLAAGFNYAIFEWRKAPSIQGFFQDAETAYEAALKKGFEPSQIKALGYCGTTYVVANLKKNHHHEGLDAVLVGAHTSFRDVVAHTQWPVNQIGLLGLGAIESPEANFDNIEKFKTLEQSQAATCLIMDPNNEIAPPETIKRLTRSLEKTENCKVILKSENCSGQQFNFNKQFEIPEIWKQYTSFLTRPISSTQPLHRV